MILLSCAWLAAALAAPTGHALLVGIGKYHQEALPADHRWQPLEGAVNDVMGMKAVLERRGFEVQTLLDEEATGGNIVNAFESHLVQKTQRGQVAVFYFSGHGQQVTDDEGGDEFDGYDESLVPYDHRGTVDSTANLIDDLFSELLKRLTDETDDVVVLFDSCFSGSGTRGVGNAAARARGEGVPSHRPAATARVRAADRERKLVDRGTGYVFLSASDSHERAYERPDASGHHAGVFTSALVSALDEMTSGATYQTLYEILRMRMGDAPGPQHPQIEGDVDKKLFSTEWGGASSHHALNLQEGKLRVDAGSMHGIGVGTIFGLYPPGTGALDPKAASAKAPVVEVHPAWSIVEGDTSRWSRGGRAIELVSSHALPQLTVHLAANSALAPALEALPGVRVVDAHEATVTLEREGGDVYLRLPAGERLPIPMGRGMAMVDRLPAGERDVKHYLTQALELEVRRRRIASLRNGVAYARIPVRLEVKTVDVVNPRMGPDGVVWDELTELATLPRDGTGSYAPDTVIQFTVHNDGDRPAHMAILEMSTDGSVRLIWPSRASGFENVVAPNASATVRMPFSLTEPAGEQVWKLVAADADVDFSSLEKIARGGATRSSNPRGVDTALAELLMDVVKPTRSTPVVAPVDMYWGTDEIRIEVAGDP